MSGFLAFNALGESESEMIEIHVPITKDNCRLQIGLNPRFRDINVHFVLWLIIMSHTGETDDIS